MPLALVKNIPREFKSHHLRTFFTDFCESTKFDCFHFRHRRINNDNESCCCSFVRFEDESILDEFIRRYDGKHWNLETVITRCFISKIDVNRDFKSLELGSLELKPPSIMPRGNVGTPTSHFLDAINRCQLPSKLITKLKLEFPRSKRRRKYGNVSLNYDEIYPYPRSRDSKETSQKNNNGDYRWNARNSVPNHGPELTLIQDNNNDDNDTCEEWERHESLHDTISARRINPTDPSQQSGTKEQSFEDEMEITWDKGSSGLVFYTDASYWKRRDTTDKDDIDDWDIDMSGYYDEDGIDNSAFKIGDFEKYTKGIGRRIMEGQGWKDGKGLGSTYEGIKDALSGDGQTTRFGFGYHGIYVDSGHRRRRRRKEQGRIRSHQSEVLISTIYDKPSETDPIEPMNRSNPAFYLKSRSFIQN